MKADAGGEVGEVGDPAAGELGHHVVPGQGEEGLGPLGLRTLHLVQGEGGAGKGGEASVDGGLEGGEEEEGEKLETPGKKERREIEDKEEATLSHSAHVTHC